MVRCNGPRTAEDKGRQMRTIFVMLVALVMATASHAQENFTLSPGDVVSIEVLEDTSLNRASLVLPDGTISFPFAGSVRAQGLTLSQLQNSLSRALAPNFATAPTVFATINRLSAPGETPGDTMTIFIIGQVNQPGEYEVDTGLTFLQALSRTGGFTPFAATKRIQLRRTEPSTGQEAIFTFDLRAVGDGARISGNTALRDGDVILVPERRLFE